MIDPGEEHHDDHDYRDHEQDHLDDHKRRTTATARTQIAEDHRAIRGRPPGDHKKTRRRPPGHSPKPSIVDSGQIPSYWRDSRGFGTPVERFKTPALRRFPAYVCREARAAGTAPIWAMRNPSGSAICTCMLTAPFLPCEEQQPQCKLAVLRFECSETTAGARVARGPQGQNLYDTTAGSTGRGAFWCASRADMLANQILFTPNVKNPIVLPLRIS